MAAAADATTAMTIDFLLSERAAKDRADQLADRVCGAGGAAPDPATEGGAGRRGGSPSSTPRASAPSPTPRIPVPTMAPVAPSTGVLPARPAGMRCRAPSWEARPRRLSPGRSRGSAAPRALTRTAGSRITKPGCSGRQRHGHSQRRSYFRLLAADYSPKYQLGQSCRKIKRKELRLQTEDEGVKDNVAEGLEEEEKQKSDCTDEQHDLDGEVSQDGRGSCGDGRGNERYTVEYEKEGEMERVLEKQAELIGQYEAQENAQREWEKKFNGSRDSASDDVDRYNKLNQKEKSCELRGRAAQTVTKEVVREEAQSRDKDLVGINSPSECLLNGSASGLSTNAPEVRAIRKCKESDNDFGRVTAVVASVDSELHVSKGELVHRSCTEIIEGSVYNNLGRSASSPQKRCNSSSNTGHNKGQGDGNSDSGSSYHANARSYEHYVTTPSVGSPLSDTPKSKMSEWSSLCFHNHTDNQIDMQLHQFSSDDVGGVLESLQRAKMSLREKLSRASPPRQDMLALPAPEDHYTEDDLQVNDTELPLCISQRLSQEILALPASGDYLSRISLPGHDAKVPVGPAGLFRLPTDSFPRNEVCSTDGYGSMFSLTSSQQTIFSRNPASHMMSTSSFPQYGSGFSLNPYHGHHS